jgi:hypothetical protein
MGGSPRPFSPFVVREITDPRQARYEHLRTAFLGGTLDWNSPDGQRFAHGGMRGLMEGQPREWIVEVCQASSPRWCGAQDPYQRTLRDVMRWLLAQHSTGCVIEEVS